jgi:hypothetical protein
MPFLLRRSKKPKHTQAQPALASSDQTDLVQVVPEPPASIRTPSPSLSASHQQSKRSFWRSFKKRNVTETALARSKLDANTQVPAPATQLPTPSAAAGSTASGDDLPNTALNVLKLALRILSSASSNVPGLKAAIDSFLLILDKIQVSYLMYMWTVVYDECVMFRKNQRMKKASVNLLTA